MYAILDTRKLIHNKLKNIHINKLNLIYGKENLESTNMHKLQMSIP